MENQKSNQTGRTEIALRMLNIIASASNPRQPAISVLMIQQSIRAADKFIELLKAEKKTRTEH